MAPPKFFADEHIGRAVIRGLRSRGVDVVSVAEAGLLGASDEELLSVAYRQGRIILTQDADFLRLHARGTTHAGVLFATQGTGIGTIVRGVLAVRDVLTDEEMRNHVEFL